VPRRLATLLVLALLGIPPLLRAWAGRPGLSVRCAPEGRGEPPRHWLGCATDPGPARAPADDERVLSGKFLRIEKPVVDLVQFFTGHVELAKISAAPDGHDNPARAQRTEDARVGSVPHREAGLREDVVGEAIARVRQRAVALKVPGLEAKSRRHPPVHTHGLGGHADPRIAAAE